MKFLRNLFIIEWNNPDYFSRKLPEIYSKVISNYAKNATAVSRMFNDLVFANVDSFKNISDKTKEHSKHTAEIGKRNARVCEGLDQDSRTQFKYTRTSTSTTH